MSDSNPPLSSKVLMLVLATGLVLAAGVALVVGGADLAVGQVFSTLAEFFRGGSPKGTTAHILWEIRIPRILLAVALGSSMGLAGLAAQTLFRNPLASPYVLGVSNGSAVGAVVAMLLLAKTFGFAAVPALSLLTGLGVGALVFVLARRSDQFGHALLLAGVAVSAFCSALTAGALYLAGERLQTLVFWLMGGLWLASWREVLLMVPVSALALVELMILAPTMNVALVGERSAGDLGVPVRRFQIILLVTICLSTAVAVAVSGVIGFVGLIVPHFLRLLAGADHRVLVPASALGGALLLLVADTLARKAAAPAEVPVGILTALVGAPVFLWFLARRTAGGGWV